MRARRKADIERAKLQKESAVQHETRTKKPQVQQESMASAVQCRCPEGVGGDESEDGT